MREFVLELVQSEYETGHQLAEDRDEFKQIIKDEGFRFSRDMYDFYQECHNLGPAGFYAEYKDELDFDPDFIAEYSDAEIELEDLPLDEALSNKEKLKRAYPQLNFDNKLDEDDQVKGQLSLFDPEISDPVKLQQAVGLLYAMDDFVLSVYDNPSWLAYGVPDGEFDEKSRDDAEKNYEDHTWMIERESGSLDVDLLLEFIQVFKAATKNSRDYDPSIRQQLIREANLMCGLSESVDDMDKRCSECNTLLNDMGKCPKCDEGEEDYGELNEATLNEVGGLWDKIKNKVKPDLERTATIADNDRKKRLDGIKKKLPSILSSTYVAGNTTFHDGEKYTYDQVVNKVSPTNVKNAIQALDFTTPITLDDIKADTKLQELIWIIDSSVVDKDGWIVRRGLETFKSGKYRYNPVRKDQLVIDDKVSHKVLFDVDLDADEKAAEEETPSPATADPAPAEPAADGEPAVAEEPAAPTAGEPEPAAADSSTVSEKSLKNFVSLCRAMSKKLYADVDDKRREVGNLDEIKPEMLDKIYVSRTSMRPLSELIPAMKSANLLETLDISDDYMIDEFAGDVYEDEVEIDDDADSATRIASGEVFGPDDYDEEIVCEDIEYDTFDDNFTTYDAVLAGMQDNCTNEQIDATIRTFDKVAKYFKINPQDIVMFVDSDFEYDPVYFADDFKELRKGLVALVVGDIHIVKELYNGKNWLYFRNRDEANSYIRFAQSENI